MGKIQQDRNHGKYAPEDHCHYCGSHVSSDSGTDDDGMFDKDGNIACVTCAEKFNLWM